MRKIEIPIEEYEQLYADFKFLEDRISDNARSSKRSKGTCGIAIPFYRPNTRAIAHAIFSYKEDRVIKVVGTYYPEDGSQDKQPIVIRNMFKMAYQFPAPIRAKHPLYGKYKFHTIRLQFYNNYVIEFNQFLN